VTLTPRDGGWDVEGLADLGRLVLGNRGAPGPLRDLPRKRIAPALERA
jgi:hypothetical protein